VGTDEGRRRLVHRSEVEGFAAMPYPMRPQRIVAGGLVDEVSVGTPHCREAGVEVGGNRRQVVDGISGPSMVRNDATRAPYRPPSLEKGT
jgi:hypothetical protein